MRERLEFLFVKFLILLAKNLPKSFIYKLFKLLAITFFYFDSKRRKLTINNLKYLYAGKCEVKLKAMAKEIYINISKTLVESLLIYIDKISKDDILKIVINKDEVLKLIEYKKEDRGVIFITAHIGNWELLSQFLAINDIKLNGVSREGNNKLIEKNITTPLREKFGNKNIYKKRAGISLMRAIKNNENIGLLIDQKTGLKNGVITKFFKANVTTTNLIANLKLKFNPLIIPVFLLRIEDEKFKLIINEPVEYIADEIEDKEAKIIKITQKYNDILESIIKEYPLQWFWMHNRWKIF